MVTNFCHILLKSLVIIERSHGVVFSLGCKNYSRLSLNPNLTFIFAPKISNLGGGISSGSAIAHMPSLLKPFDAGVLLGNHFQQAIGMKRKFVLYVQGCKIDVAFVE